MHLKRLCNAIISIQIVPEFTFDPCVEHLSNVLEGITTTNFESHLLSKMSKHAHKEDQIAKHTPISAQPPSTSIASNAKWVK